MKHFFLLLALFCAGGFGSSMAWAQALTISPAAEATFGTRESDGKAINDGAVFVDGKFLRAPYTVTRKGNGLFINGTLVKKVSISAEDPTAKKGAAEERPASVEDELGFSDFVEKPDPAPVAAQDAHGQAGSEGGYVSDKEGASIGGKKPVPSDVPTLDESTAPKEKPKDVFQRRKEKAEQKVYNETELFEEADYTFTPPKRPEPPAVKYIRPATTTLKERAEAQKAKEEEAAKKRAEAKGKGETLEVPDEGVAGETVADTPDAGTPESTESFEGLSEERIERAKKVMDATCAKYERALRAGKMLLFMVADSWDKEASVKATESFLMEVPDILKDAADAKAFVAAVNAKFPVAEYPYLDANVLTQIYDNIAANRSSLGLVAAKLKREQKQREEARKRRLR